MRTTKRTFIRTALAGASALTILGWQNVAICRNTVATCSKYRRFVATSATKLVSCNQQAVKHWSGARFAESPG